jgi:uncharacterized protein (TIGR02301 family)
MAGARERGKPAEPSMRGELRGRRMFRHAVVRIDGKVAHLPCNGRADVRRTNSQFSPKTSPTATRRGLALGMALSLAAAVGAASWSGEARAAQGDVKPYDDKLMRLAEILGSVHYLRELCSASDGQLWRERMRELIDAEGGTAIRRARLSRSFNQGYRSYRRTYVTCTPTAQSSIERFLAEGIQIGETLVKTAP